MSEMVERVGRALAKRDDAGDVDAIWAAVKAEPIHSGDCTEEAHTCLLCQVERYEGDARVAIAAMREPTEGMLRRPIHLFMVSDAIAASVNRKHVWQELIDEALK